MLLKNGPQNRPEPRPSIHLATCILYIIPRFHRHEKVKGLGFKEIPTCILHINRRFHRHEQVKGLGRPSLF